MSKERLTQIKDTVRSLQAQLFDYRQVVYSLEDQIAGLRAEYETLDRQLAETDGRKKVVKVTSNNGGKQESVSDAADRVKHLSQDKINQLIAELGEI